MSEDAPPPLPPGPPTLNRQVTRSGFDHGEPHGSTAPLVAGAEVAKDADRALSAFEAAAAASESLPTAPAAAAAAAASAAAAAAPPKPRPRTALRMKLGGVTDPGGPGKENQDDFFMWASPDGSVVAVAVLDGHGRELGRMASEAASRSLLASLSNADTAAALKRDPQGTMERVFEQAHGAVKEAFVRRYTQMGLEVKEAEKGYLVVRAGSSHTWNCVFGGTTATVAVVLDRRYLVVANVGDSSAMLGTYAPGAAVVRPSDFPQLLAGTYDAAAAAAAAASEGELAKVERGELPEMPPKQSVDNMRVVHVSSDHSPESPAEFKRVRAFRPSPTSPLVPEILFVYDSFSYNKHSCSSIFSVREDGAVSVTNKGSYYKNVRNEWASLVATPSHARYQDALAFTRSLGDFHLQCYGVNHKPDVWCLDLAESLSGADADPSVPRSSCVVLATDGVWDNWTYQDSMKWLLSPEVLAEVAQSRTAESVASKYMAANYERAMTNFGASADNMTAITIYILPGASSAPPG